MDEVAKPFIRRVIDGKEYICKKLPYSQSRELQFSMQKLLIAMAGQLDTKSDEELIAVLPTIIFAQGSFSTIKKLCETCVVDGAPVRMDSFDPETDTDLKVAALALETHFLNFTQALSDGLGEATKAKTPTKS